MMDAKLLTQIGCTMVKVVELKQVTSTQPLYAKIVILCLTKEQNSQSKKE
jgi:hypothetical protein